MAEHLSERTGDDRSELEHWQERTRINLSPIAAPSVLGLYGFAVSTFMVSANLATCSAIRASHR